MSFRPVLASQGAVRLVLVAMLASSALPLASGWACPGTHRSVNARACTNPALIGAFGASQNPRRVSLGFSWRMK